MATLKQLAQLVLEEKNNKVLPNKIEDDWQIFNITGEYTPEIINNINVFIDTDEPETYDGIWIKSNTFTYNDIIQIESASEVNKSSINLIKGNTYRIKLFNSSTTFTYSFNDILLTDNSNNIIDNIEIYYGDSVSWNKLNDEEEIEIGEID